MVVNAKLFGSDGREEKSMSQAKADILVVDDQPDNLRILAAILKIEGYRVRKATSGAMALATLSSQRPDIILLDIRMPEMDGFAVCTSIKASPENCDIPIIFISALGDMVDKVKAFNLGGADYITKPFRAEEVLVRIRHQLTIQRQQQQLLQQNQRLQLEIQKRQLLGRVIHHIRQSLQLDEILQATVEEMRQLFQVDQVLVCCFQTGWVAAVVAESNGVVAQSLQGQTIDDFRFQQYWQQLDSQPKASIISDVKSSELKTSDLADYAQFLAWLQVRACLALPIYVEETVWGLLIAQQYKAPRKWAEWETDFFQQLTEQLAIAIQQAQLYQRVQFLNTNLEQQVNFRTAELRQVLEYEAVLRRITDQVRDSLDENQILQTAIEKLAKVLGVAHCEAVLCDSSCMPSGVRYQHTEIDLGSNQAQLLSLLELAEIRGQLQQGWSFAMCQMLDETPQNATAVLVCPVFDHEGAVGSLWLFKLATADFSEPEIRLVQQVANQCAIALRQARLYQAAQSQLRELQRLSQLKDDFLSTVSHELRTPLANIQMVLRLLDMANSKNQAAAELSTPPQANQESQENTVTGYLKILQDECEQELRLIQDLLDMQQLDAGTCLFEPVTINLNDWLPHVIEPFEVRTRNQQQILHVHIASDLLPLTTDVSSLMRILVELLNNASKYTIAGETITVTASMEAEMLKLQVCNSGIEIPAEEMPRVFDKFYRIPTHDPWKYGGTGLGLALVKKLVEHINGSIHVESAKHQTCFVVKLPLNQP